MENMNVNRNDKPCCKGAYVRSYLLGFAVILVGLLLIARNFGMIDTSVSRIIFSWPMIIVAVGLITMINGKYGSGIIIIVVGLFFLLTRFFNMPFSVGQVFWPVLIILAGLAIIFGSIRFSQSNRISITSGNDDYLEDIAVFGGGNKKVLSQSFKGGKLLAVFGGSEIDLSRAILAPGGAAIEVVCIFGGTSIIVPADWDLRVDVVKIFGGYEDKRFIQSVDPGKRVVVKGVALFGGFEVKGV